MLFMLGLIATGGWWLSEEIATDRSTAQTGSAALPDYSMRDFTLTSMSREGKPKHMLTADSMIHHPDQGSSDLLNPYLEFYRPPQQPWRIRSETGKANDEGSLVNLLGEVHIWREASDNTRAMTLDTHNLTVQPNRDYAETHEPVQITTEGSTIQGTGMRAYFDTEQVELLSDVRGVHEFKNQIR